MKQLILGIILGSLLTGGLSYANHVLEGETHIDNLPLQPWDYRSGNVPNFPRYDPPVGPNQRGPC